MVLVLQLGIFKPQLVVLAHVAELRSGRFPHLLRLRCAHQSREVVDGSDPGIAVREHDTWHPGSPIVLVEAVAAELPSEGTPLYARRVLGEASAVFNYECPFGWVPLQNLRPVPGHVA